MSYLQQGAHFATLTTDSRNLYWSLNGLLCFSGLWFHSESMTSTLELKNKTKQTKHRRNTCPEKEWKLIFMAFFFVFFFFFLMCLSATYQKRNTSVLWGERFTVYSGWGICDILLFLQWNLIWGTVFVFVLWKTSLRDYLYLGVIKVCSVHIYLLCKLVSEINIYLFHVVINNLWCTWLNCNP